MWLWNSARNFIQSEEILLSEEPSGFLLANPDYRMEWRGEPWINPSVWVIKYLGTDWLMLSLCDCFKREWSPCRKSCKWELTYWGPNNGLQTYFTWGNVCLYWCVTHPQICKKRNHLSNGVGTTQSHEAWASCQDVVLSYCWVHQKNPKGKWGHFSLPGSQ